MQHRHRSSRDARRPHSRSGHRNFGGGFNRKPYRSILRRKEEIFMKAGRLAAKYLVSIGLLPPSSIRPEWESNNRSDEFRRRDRDCRRSYGDGDDNDERRRRMRRNGGYESDRGRKRGRWRRRDWGYRDDVDGADDFHRRRRFRGRRVGSEEIDGLEPENRDGVDDYGLKMGSSRARKGIRCEADLDLIKVVDGEGGDLSLKDGDDTTSYESGEVREDDLMDVLPFVDEGESKNGNDLLELCRVGEVPTRPRSLLAQRNRKMDGCGGSSSNRRETPIDCTIDLNKTASEDSLESDGEVRMDISDDLKGKSLCKKSEGCSELDMTADLEGKSLCEDFDVADLKLCGFTNVPTKPRTTFPRRSSKIDQLFPNKANNIVAIASDVPKAIGEEDVVGGFSSDPCMNQIDTSKGEELTVFRIAPIQHVVEESVDQPHELIQSPEFWGSFGQTVNVSEEIQSLRQSLKPEIRRFLVDEEMVTGCVADQEKPVHGDSSPKSEPELNIQMVVEEQLQPTLFKVCDLNLMAPPDTIEVRDDLVLDDLHFSVPVSEASRDLPVGFGCMTGNTTKDTNNYCRLSGDRMIQVIDLKDDSLTESNAYDSLEPKNGTTHSGMMNLTENKDLHDAYSGCSLAISEFHQTDILGCPLPPSDLNNPQTGIGIPGAKVEGWGLSDSAV